MRKINVFLIFLLSLVISSYQTSDHSWKFISSIPVKPVDKVSTDLNNNIYTTDKAGSVYKYDSLGILNLVYSPQKNTAISLLEANRGVNIFLFYREFQQYRMLNRFLSEISTHSLDARQTGTVRLATLSADNNLWVIDDADFSLKKINLGFNRIEIENSLQLIVPPGEYDFMFMREYDNRLYIADRNSGILVFDNMGNYLTKISVKGVSHFNFLGNSLYFLAGPNLYLVNTRKGLQQMYPLPEGTDPLYIVLKSKKAYLITPSSMEIFEHNLSL